MVTMNLAIRDKRNGINSQTGILYFPLRCRVMPCRALPCRPLAMGYSQLLSIKTIRAVLRRAGRS